MVVMKRVGEGGGKEKELGSQYLLQGHTPNDLSSFHYAPPLKGFTTSQWC
jgi:hypothetical protein